MSAEECHRRLRAGLRIREACFLDRLTKDILNPPANPFARMLRAARIGESDIRRCVRTEGLENTLRWLHAEGVYMSLEEFKGRRPVKRPGLGVHWGRSGLEAGPQRGGFSGTTGGSSGPPTELRIGFDYLRRCGVGLGAALAANDLLRTPLSLWLPAPPSPAGLLNCLLYARMGLRLSRWFAHERPATPYHALMTRGTRTVARLLGHHLPAPEHMPVSRADAVATFLAREVGRSGTSVLNTYVSTAVRVARAARERGLSLAGVTFLTGSEPLTAGRREAIESAGAQVVHTYWITELGLLGVACTRCSSPPDRVHLLTHNMAVVQPEGGPSGRHPALCFTPLLAGQQPTVINLEVGDTARLLRGSCDCELGAAGLNTFAHTVRSVRRVTAEGVTLATSDFATLVDSILPAAFGGGPGDYQVVEEISSDAASVLIRVHPRLGRVETGEVIRLVRRHVRTRNPQVAGILDGADAFRVQRKPPLLTPAGKLHPVLLRGETLSPATPPGT
ncbi:MAG: hypothetical protein R6X33_06065 [Candidatus Brocadiia bacterium]